jgi:small basic protein
MFGKRLSEYLGFQKEILALLAAVGLARLGLSLVGVPDSTAAWLSMNVVTWAGALYYGVAVHMRGFGSYKQILPLALFQMVLQQSIAVLGILLAIGGYPNIYAAPEFSFGAQSQWLHILSHLTIGILVPPFLLWGVASLALLITKRVAGRPEEERPHGQAAARV